MHPSHGSLSLGRHSTPYSSSIFKYELLLCGCDACRVFFLAGQVNHQPSLSLLPSTTPSALPCLVAVNPRACFRLIADEKPAASPYRQPDEAIARNLGIRLHPSIQLARQTRNALATTPLRALTTLSRAYLSSTSLVSPQHTSSFARKQPRRRSRVCFLVYG